MFYDYDRSDSISDTFEYIYMFRFGNTNEGDDIESPRSIAHLSNIKTETETIPPISRMPSQAIE